MRSLALRVRRADAERVRRALGAAGLLRTDLKIRSSGGAVVIPIAAPPSGDGHAGEVVEEEFESGRAARTRSYRDLLQLPADEAALLPSAFDVIGDIVLVRLPRSLEPRAGEIGEALRRFVPGARLVGLDRGVVGRERRRSVERIAGSGPWTTRHSENGFAIDVDVERAYFSPRLAREHARVAEAVRPGELVYDLCCGVGPFALTVARSRRAQEVVAVDSNPRAIELLRSSITRLGLGGRVRPLETSLEEFLPTAERSNRAILNLPHEGIKYVASVAAALGPSGVLHYYEVTERAVTDARSSELLRLLEPAGEWGVAGRRIVHPYSPSSDLVSYTIQRLRG